MNYSVVAYRCKVGSIIDLADEVTPVGVTYEGGELFIVCLQPVETRHLAEEEEKKTEEKED